MGGDGAAAAGARGVPGSSADAWLEHLDDIREYDVTYHHRVSIDMGVRVGKWYTVSEEGGGAASARLTPCEERKAFGEPRVLAFDIECCKQPLKFPDASTDPVMMISCAETQSPRPAA